MQSVEYVPTSREQSFLSALFEILCQFSHDKAKDFIEKERESTRNKSTLLWSSFMNMLGTLVCNEKSFYSLEFLCQNFGARFLGRKDVLITSYNCMKMEFKRIEHAHRGTEESPTSPVTSHSSLAPSPNLPYCDTERFGGSVDETVEQLIVALCKDLQEFCSARIEVIRFYEKLLTIGSCKQISYVDIELITKMQKITETFENSVTHPVLSTLKSNFLQENEIILLLLQCHSDIQNYRFLSSLSCIKDAKYKLDQWMDACLTSETRKSAAVTKTNVSELHSWLISYKNALYSKFTLYFCEAFMKQATQTDLRATMSKTSIDYYAKISVFHKRTDAASVCFVLNTNELPEIYQGPGYHLPFVSTPPQKSTGLDSFPAIFCFPSDRPDKHWPSVVSILTHRTTDLTIVDKVLINYDDKIQASYFMIQVDPLVTLTVIYECRKLPKDAVILNFLTTIASELRCAKVFASLKPGSK